MMKGVRGEEVLKGTEFFVSHKERVLGCQIGLFIVAFTQLQNSKFAHDLLIADGISFALKLARAKVTFLSDEIESCVLLSRGYALTVFIISLVVTNGISCEFKA